MKSLLQTLRYSLGLTSLSALISCTPAINYYEQSKPTLVMEEFFNGPLLAYGMVQDRSGKVLRRFKVNMEGQWQENTGTLSEHFEYDDGEKQTRIWHITKHPDGSYTGTAGDVVRPATGASQGFALNWHYSLALVVDGKTWHIDFNDWMYLLDEQRLINRAEMSKWGFKVGEVTLWVEKQGVN